MRAAIFDFDGVLVDSEPLHFGSLRDALLPEGIVIDQDAPRSKPDPAPSLTALGRLQPLLPGLAAGECLAFEDSMPGIASARAAGMKVVAVTNSYAAEKLSLAHAVVPTLEGLAASGL